MSEQVEMEVCDRCGKPRPGPEVMDYVRSVEWRVHIKRREPEIYPNAGVSLSPVNLCRRCKRLIEAILYDWMNGLPLSHQPFMPA